MSLLLQHGVEQVEQSAVGLAEVGMVLWLLGLAAEHGVAFAFTGDFRTYQHLVQILDSRTGTLIKSYDSPGMWQGFAASKKTGLIEMREFNDMAYPADGSDPHDVPTFLGFRSGVFATSVGGTEAFVGGTEAFVGAYLWSHDTPFADNDGFLRESATDSVLGASPIQRARPGGGPGDDLIGLALTGGP
ncbi:hypothetical protein [Streptomyces sp. NPDC001222]|uniref:hypothetical protein n=1 Tax=Streptomyces sp. NPDC001222 TaxID=3364548 RepID=UPI00367F9A4A